MKHIAVSVGVRVDVEVSADEVGLRSVETAPTLVVLIEVREAPTPLTRSDSGPLKQFFGAVRAVLVSSADEVGLRSVETNLIS